MRRIVLCLSHSIEEHDQLRLLHEIGHEVASIGGYIDPAHPHDPKRPALPQIPMVPAIKEAVDGIGSEDNLGAAQALLPDAVLEWADTIIYHHYLDRLYDQWPRIRDWLRGDSNRRVIWRTVGQSVEGNEFQAQPFHHQGLEIVRYSPKERNIPQFAGEDALIRFYKDPEEWCGWTGDKAIGYGVDGDVDFRIDGGATPQVIQITQHLRQRDPYTNWGFWEEATNGLPRMPLGPGSEVIGGPGELTYDDMKECLRAARVYLYTGTQPASYTLGLIEAMMTGIPVVSIGPEYMGIFPYGPQLFEGHELAPLSADVPDHARGLISLLLNVEDAAREYSTKCRDGAIAVFGIDTIREQWRAFLA